MESCTASGNGPSRRDVLRAGACGAGLAGLSAIGLDSARAAGERDLSCIIVFLVGGPSHIDTWDPKPDAPDHVRGPFKTIRTNVPGIHISEAFPLVARRADRYVIIRSVFHNELPIHETGQQFLQTGHLASQRPHLGAAISFFRGRKRAGVPAAVTLPHSIGNTGVAISHGQGAGILGSAHEPVLLDSGVLSASERYGHNLFGGSCARAVELVQAGVRVVTVNMFDTVFNKVTWDCHADGEALASTLDDYQNVLCPTFDRAYTALLDDLEQRGMLSTTMVVAMGEFGRTPLLNRHGGRDHWTRCWSVLYAGGPVQGGQVIGSSDRCGAEPIDRPVHAAQIAATIYRAMGVDPSAVTIPGPEGKPVALVDMPPVHELLAR